MILVCFHHSHVPLCCSAPGLQGRKSWLWVEVDDIGNRTATSTTAVIQSVCWTNLDTLCAQITTTQLSETADDKQYNNMSMAAMGKSDS